MIKPSRKLASDIRKLVEVSFKNAIDEIGEAEFCYVESNIERKLQGLKKSRTSWVRQLGTYNEAFYLIYREATNGKLALPDKSLRTIGAALFYLANPYDIIPDHTPGEGYIDDAHVANLCLRYVGRKHPDLFGQYLSAIVDG